MRYGETATAGKSFMHDAVNFISPSENQDRILRAR
jgi:hypothetical protein